MKCKPLIGEIVPDVVRLSPVTSYRVYVSVFCEHCGRCEDLEFVGSRVCGSDLHANIDAFVDAQDCTEEEEDTR